LSAKNSILRTVTVCSPCKSWAENAIGTSESEISDKDWWLADPDRRRRPSEMPLFNGQEVADVAQLHGHIQNKSYKSDQILEE
jgi:hypothetical protein